MLTGPCPLLRTNKNGQEGKKMGGVWVGEYSPCTRAGRFGRRSWALSEPPVTPRTASHDRAYLCSTYKRGSTAGRNGAGNVSQCRWPCRTAEVSARQGRIMHGAHSLRLTNSANAVTLCTSQLCKQDQPRGGGSGNYEGQRGKKGFYRAVQRWHVLAAISFLHV
jgi:hypothetical protein